MAGVSAKWFDLLILLNLVTLGLLIMKQMQLAMYLMVIGMLLDATVARIAKK
jgi:uncharacterized membrane protein YfhO